MYEISTAELCSIYDRLFEACRKENFEGYDPFDGLNSGVFKAIPFAGRSRLARLFLIQSVKRSPVELRSLLNVPKGVNPKGLALFASAEMSRYRATGSPEKLESAKALLSKMIDRAIEPGEGQLAWGYNFDWQSRAFYAPLGTPTIVPTAFAAFALLDTYRETRSKELLQMTGSICRFISKGLNRPVDTARHLCFSYTPIDQSVILNASLLAAETLAAYDFENNSDRFDDLIQRAARYVVDSMDEDGAWHYGPKLRHRWVDNFHTAYILVSLQNINAYLHKPSEEIENAITRGTRFWTTNFFLNDGTPKYYKEETYPVDIHSAAAAIWALSELSSREQGLLERARNVASRTITLLKREDGKFGYQLRRSRKDMRSYMRWNNAWMALAIARLLEESGQKTEVRD